MKLRMEGNSIRLRLGRSDLAEFAGHGQIEEELSFPGGRRLVYGLEVSNASDRPSAALHEIPIGVRLVVHLPESWVGGWADSDRVGFESQIPLEDGNRLTILVEKDLECRHRPKKEQDAFPHPVADRKSG